MGNSMNRSIFTGLVSAFVLVLSISVNAKERKVFNPDISANLLGLVTQGTGLSDNRSDPAHNGLRLQEAELQLTSDVDYYFYAFAVFAIRQTDTTSAGDGSIQYGIEPEEFYFETLRLPSLTLRAGKMKLAFGKHSPLHTHAMPFLDAPLTQATLIGDEGLNETAISAAVLLPTNWFSEITLQAFSASNADLFNATQSGSLGGLVRLKNLWDLTEDTTLELGLSGARAKNSIEQHATVCGSDLTVKWRPAVGGKYQALVWNTEYLRANRKGLTDGAGEDIARLGGLTTYLQYQFAERWWVQARAEILGLPKPATISRLTKQSAVLAFIPSEFSGIRLQYDHQRTENQAKADHTASLQYNITIGAHPAHSY